MIVHNVVTVPQGGPAHHVVRLWCSPRPQPRRAAAVVQIRWKFVHFPSVVLGTMAFFDKKESLDQPILTRDSDVPWDSTVS